MKNYLFQELGVLVKKTNTLLIIKEQKSDCQAIRQPREIWPINSKGSLASIARIASNANNASNAGNDSSSENSSEGTAAVTVPDIPNFWKMKVDPSTRRRSAGGIIVNRDFTHIVLVRSRTSGKWGIPKGGVEDHETDIEGAIREIYEECSLVIESPLIEAMAPCITYRGVRIFLFCYNAPITEKELVAIDTLEISECGWFPLDFLRGNPLDLEENESCDPSDASEAVMNTADDNDPQFYDFSRLPTISTELYSESSSVSLQMLNMLGLPSKVSVGNLVPIRKYRVSMTILLRDLLKDRLDAIIRKIKTNIDNYQVLHGRIIINSYLANLLKQLRKSDMRQVNIIHDIQLRFPMVFYLPELIRVLDSAISIQA